MTVVDAALFHNLYWNLIEPKMASLIPPTFQLDNLARARISGLELSFETAFYRQRVRIQGAYTYLDASRLGEIQPIFTLDNLFYMPSRTLPYRPRHLLQLHVSYRQAKWTIGMDFRYMSRFEEVLVYPSDFRVSQKVWDAFVEFQITSRCSFLMRINNLFNYHYVEMERDLAPIRHVIFTLNWQRLRK
jgi:outer membrane cobalamin receptor